MIHARAAIIGGGIMGASALYHLVRNGWTDTVLLEKAELTSGSTWHAAGQITHAVGSHVMGWINKASIECYKEAEAASGQSVGWHECGGLRVARDADELDWLKSMLGIGKGLDLPMELVGPDAMKKLHPYYEIDGIIAALHTPFDGHVDPSGATFALAAAARSSGGTVIKRNRVLGAERRGSDWLLRTEQDDVIAEHVVIAAGAYANQVGAWFGLEFPSVNCLHHYFVTDPVPEFAGRETELPVIRDNFIEGYVRQEQKSALIGVFENEDAPTAWDDGGPWDAEHPLFEADYERVGDFLELAISRMPVLANLGIRRTVRGILSHTPDGGMLVGPSGVRNVWLACGSSIGLAWGGGSGRALADWMVHGSAEISTRGLDPRRYGGYADRTYAMAVSKEDFETRHQTPVPGFQRLAGRPWRKHPIYERLAEKGAVFGEVAGWERPRWFAASPKKEDSNGWRRQPWHDAAAREASAVRESAGVIDLSAFAQFEITGRDARAFLDRLSANRIPTADGRIALCHLINEQGRFEAELTVARLDANRYFTGSPIMRRRSDLQWLRENMLPGQDVAIRDLSDDWGLLALAGPASRRILAHATNIDLGNEAFPWMTAKSIRLFGVEVVALRMSFTGELGWELHMPLDSIAEVYEGLFEAGADHGLCDLGSHAFNSLRMEKAYRASAELTPDIGMVEAGMLRFFRPEGREFIGKDATLKAMDEGPRWRLAYLEVDADDADCHGGEAILHDGRAVGLVSSGAYGYFTGKSLAFGFVQADCTAEELTVMILGEERSARKLACPAHDPSSSRPRQ